MKYCRKLKLKNNQSQHNVNKIKENSPESKDNLDVLFAVNENASNDWILDSGATSHFTNNEEYYCDLDNTFQTSVQVANGCDVRIQGIGDCKTKSYNQKGVMTNVKLTNVLYAPSLRGSFISINKLTSKGFRVNFFNQQGEIFLNEKQIALAPLSNHLFELKNEKLCATIEDDKCIPGTVHSGTGTMKPSRQW